MNIFLFSVILLQFIYMVYSDIQNRKERESLQVKIMSKNLDDYKNFSEDIPSNSVLEEDPYLSIEEAGLEKIIKAKDKR